MRCCGRVFLSFFFVSVYTTLRIIIKKKLFDKIKSTKITPPTITTTTTKTKYEKKVKKEANGRI